MCRWRTLKSSCARQEVQEAEVDGPVEDQGEDEEEDEMEHQAKEDKKDVATEVRRMTSERQPSCLFWEMWDRVVNLITPYVGMSRASMDLLQGATTEGKLDGQLWSPGWPGTRTETLEIVH